MAVAQWKKANTWLPGPIAQVLVVAFLTALINYPNFYMKLQTTELVSNLFAECSKVLDDPFGLCKTGAASASTIVLLIFAAVVGFFLAAITFGLQIPAGIILPSMAIGALTGRAVGIVMEIWVSNHPNFFLFSSCEPDVPCITPGTYAIVGAAAALAGVTRMTVSIVVIMFELTGALTYVLPIMIAVMISNTLHLVASYFQKLGLRYVLFSDRGVLQGLLTKKDVWYVLNGAEETRRTSGLPGGTGLGVETGVTGLGLANDDNDAREQHGLLRGADGGDDQDSIGGDERML
ncbi:chloride channel 3 [Ilyonectria robusta]